MHAFGAMFLELLSFLSYCLLCISKFVDHENPYQYAVQQLVVAWWTVRLFHVVYGLTCLMGLGERTTGNFSGIDIAARPGGGSDGWVAAARHDDGQDLVGGRIVLAGHAWA